MLGIEEVPIVDLKPNPDNPRINDAAVDAVARSIQAYGFNNPIVTDENLNIAAGHTRLKAAQKLGLNTVPVIKVPGLVGSKFTGYAIADNQTATISDWDEDILKQLISTLNDDTDFDLLDLAFPERELSALLEDNGNGADEDDIPEPPAKPITKPGDIWVLGDHRLLCGDATKPEDAALVMAGKTPFLMVTDPPYGVSYDPEWRAVAGINKNKNKMGKVENDDNADWSEAWPLFPGIVAYVWHGGLHAGKVADSLTACGFLIRGQIVWVKDRFALSRGHYHWQHEPCWYAARGAVAWGGDRKQSTIWNVPARDDGGVGHGAQKPVECMARPIRNHGKRGDGVYDPFVGSGTTVIAAEKLGRRCYAIEIDPGYCDVVIQRWEQFTGEKAVRGAV